jgi:hypothetical protein
VQALRADYDDKRMRRSGGGGSPPLFSRRTLDGTGHVRTVATRLGAPLAGLDEGEASTSRSASSKGGRFANRLPPPNSCACAKGQGAAGLERSVPAPSNYVRGTGLVAKPASARCQFIRGFDGTRH